MKKQQPLIALAVMIALFAQAQGITTPQTASPAANVSQTIGISKVSVSYARPSVKKREIWGALVPYGWNKQGFGNNKDAPWRAGANMNTIVELSHDAKVEGQAVPAGKYGLFFTINADNSGEVILSKDYQSWGSFWYEAGRDQLRAKIQVRSIPHTEMLTYDFINLNKTSGELVLNWEQKQFPVKIEFAVDELVMANAVEELKGPVGFNWQGFASAANYAVQNKMHLDKALGWIDQAIAQNSNYNTLNTKARILKEMGKTAEADKAKAEALVVAKEPDLNAYGYQLLGENKMEEAIKIFVTTTDRYPNSANAWDSLGEAYATKGDKENAIKSFKKSLSLNPPDNVRANSEKYMKQLEKK
jgi:tetratricopeptide (TPR) repeat protein